MTRSAPVLLLIHHSHTDIGYTEPQGRITRWHIDFIRQALAAAETTPGFKWQCECFWQVEQFRAAATDDEWDRFLVAVKTGRIGVSGSYLNFSELLDDDNLGVITSRAAEFGKENGLPVTSAMTADINGYSWGFAQAMLDAGIENLFTCIHTHHGMYPLGGQQTGFQWEAPAGDKVLVWSGEHYHFGNELGLSPGAGASYLTKDECDAEAVFTDHWKLAETRIPRYLAQLKKDGYPFDFVPLMISGLRTDNGPPNPRIAEVVDRWNREHEDICLIEMATLDDFFGRLRDVADTLPTCRGDWPDWWTDGTASYPGGTRLFRQAQRDLAQYRALVSRHPEVEETESDGAGEQAVLQDLALYAEHTFSHQDSVSRPGHFLVQAIAGVKQARAAEAVDKVTGLLDLAEARLGGGALRAGLQPRFRVINPWSHPLAGLVRLTIGHHEFYELGMNRGVTVSDPTTGRALPWWCDSVPRGEDYCAWLDLAAGEDMVLHLEPGDEKPTWPPDGPRRSSAENSAQPAAHQLENDHVRIDWAPGQGIVGWLDKNSGRDLLRPDRPHAPFTLIHERSPVEDPGQMLQVRGAMGLNRKSPDVEITAASFGKGRFLDGGPIFSGVEFPLDLPGIGHAKITFRAMNTAPRVEVELKFQMPGRWEPENIYLALPFQAGPASQVWLDKTGGLMRPRLDQLPGTLTDYYSVQAGMMHTGDDLSVLIATPDSNLIQLGSLDHGERLLMGDARLPDDPAHAYAWLMTNYWETNFGAELGGFHEFRFTVEVVNGDLNPAALQDRIRALGRGLFCFRLGNLESGKMV